MPLGLWRSKVEIYREENDRRHAEWKIERGEWRERHEELIARIDENHREVMAALKANTEELIAMRKELTLTRIELTDAIKANTDAILRLIDRFDQWEGRPPGPPDLRSV